MRSLGIRAVDVACSCGRRASVCNDPSDSAQVMLLIRKHGLA
jgi:hypothetical protein